MADAGIEFERLVKSRLTFFTISSYSVRSSRAASTIVEPCGRLVLRDYLGALARAPNQPL